MKVVVTGEAGISGKKLAPLLRERGHEAVAASPSSDVNTLMGEELAEILVGAHIVVEASNSPSFEGGHAARHLKVTLNLDLRRREKSE